MPDERTNYSQYSIEKLEQLLPQLSSKVETELVLAELAKRFTKHYVDLTGSPMVQSNFGSNKSIRSNQEKGTSTSRKKAEIDLTTLSNTLPSPGLNHPLNQVKEKGKANTNLAVIVELLAGWSGFLGVGHLVMGRSLIGLALLLGWWATLIIGAVVAVGTQGIALMCLGPIWFITPIVSAVKISTTK
ncbi:MAG: hypothetical protein HC875_01375 [Anaerolineales bacterium]|nr:hypothetical protein [Anaerolineales bacterium]